MLKFNTPGIEPPRLDTNKTIDKMYVIRMPDNIRRFRGKTLARATAATIGVTINSKCIEVNSYLTEVYTVFRQLFHAIDKPPLLREITFSVTEAGRRYERMYRTSALDNVSRFLTLVYQCIQLMTEACKLLSGICVEKKLYIQKGRLDIICERLKQIEQELKTV